MTWIFQHHVNYIANCSASPGGGDSKTSEFRAQGLRAANNNKTVAAPKNCTATII